MKWMTHKIKPYLKSRVYKRLQKVNTKEKYLQIPQSKIVIELKIQYSKQVTQIANTYLKRHSISLIIRKIPINSVLRFHLTLVRMANISKKANFSMNMGTEEHLLTYGGNVNHATTMEINMNTSLKTKNGT